MKLKHSFFICDEDNCTDKEKLVQKLAQKVQKELECIYCDYYKHKSFKTFQDVQNHMVSLGHCMMNPDYLHDYDDFYDYSEENMRIIQKYLVDEEAAKNLKNVMAVKVEHKDEKKEFDIKEENEDEWVEMSDDDQGHSQQRAKKTAKLPTVDGEHIVLDGNLIDPKKKYNLRQFFVRKVTVNHLGELVLPNNKVLGNKKYKVFYNQRFRDNQLEKQHLIRALENHKVINSSTELVLHSNIDELRALYKKTVAVQNEERFKNFKKFEENKDKISQDYTRIYIKRMLKMNQRHNRVLSKHYRDRNLCV